MLIGDVPIDESGLNISQPILALTAATRTRLYWISIIVTRQLNTALSV